MKRFFGIIGFLTIFASAITFSSFAREGAIDFASNVKVKDCHVQMSDYSVVGEFATLASGEVKQVDTSGKTKLRKSSIAKALPNSINGTYVMTVNSLRPDIYGDTGNSIVISTIENADSVMIQDFWSPGCKIFAAVNLTAGTVSIPNQVLGKNGDGVTLDFAFCESNGKPNRTKSVTGYINPDGTLNLTDSWGIYAADGEQQDMYAFVGTNTFIERANATMEFEFLGGRKMSIGVVVSQPYDNQVLVKNFANYGQTVKITLDSERGGVIPSQVARIYPSNKANFITGAVGSYSEQGNPESISANINLLTAATNDNTTLRWGNWSAFSNGTNPMFFGAIVNGKITYETGFRYPNALSETFEGEGTQESPYLLKSISDFILLANKVNTQPRPAVPDTLGGFLVVQSYTGKHFRLENDIDASSVLTTPIGYDLSHVFNGVFDGNGHTITGLVQEVGSAGMAGLFGFTGKASIIKNVTLKSPKISAAGLIASPLVAWSYGTVDNCHSIDASVVNTMRIASGLVGAGEIITNCSAINPIVNGLGGNSAGLAGQVNMKIENCFVENGKILAASPTSGYPAGGVVASMNGATGKYLYFSGTIDSQIYQSTLTIGGITGILSNGSLSNSFAVGTIRSGMSVTGENAVGGGVVGTMYGSELYDCSFSGNVGTYYSRMAGGITGWVKSSTLSDGTTLQPTIRNCYTTSVVTSETYLYNASTEVRESLGTIDSKATPTIENVYFDRQFTNLNSAKFGAYTAELTSATGPKGFSSDEWQFTEGQYPRVKQLANSKAAELAGSAIIMPALGSLKKLSANAKINGLGNTTYSLILNGEYSQNGHYCSIVKDSLVISDSFGTDTLAIRNGNVEFRYEVKIAPVPFAGDGSELNPYLISSKSDLEALGHITTVIKQYFPGSYFKLTEDLDMQHDATFQGICVDKDAYCKFAGTFDGNGHTIDNLKFDWVVWTTTPEQSPSTGGTPDSNASMYNGTKGLFGRLAPEAVIKNLNIGKGCNFSFWSRSGAIVGQNEGLVENCRNYADITAISACAGGIVGENRKGTVRSCYNAGNIISGYNSAGGIVGTGNGIIEMCANTGDVSVRYVSTFQKPSGTMNKAGGIQGENTGTNFFDCINYGTVYAYQDNVGGISAQLSKITATSVLGNNSMRNVMNLGLVKVGINQALTGAIGGNSGTSGSISGVYWDKQLIPLQAHGGVGLGGAIGLNTSELISGTLPEGFDSNIWSAKKGSYPILSIFEDEPNLISASAMVVSMPEGTGVANLSDGATLSKSEGNSWKLTKGDSFKLDGNLLISPENATSILTDTLTVNNRLFQRIIPIACLPAVPLSGRGTDVNPYLIQSAQDWNALATYINESGQNFEGKYIALTNDIDFGGKGFTALFCNGVTGFNGTLDGKNYTVKGIEFTVTASYQAAIGLLGTAGIIKNLTLEGNVNSAFTYTGGFTGKVYGNLINCTNKINVTSTKASVGGFGYIYGGSELTDVCNDAIISGAAGSVAGIASATTEGVKFIRVGNRGTVKSTATSTATYIGGLVAQCHPAIFIECYNTGKFDIGNQTATNSVGGLVAYANSTAGHSIVYEFTDCSNDADISANNIIGGIVAQSTGSTTTNINALMMKGCINRGNISSVAAKSTSSSPTAGIVAFYTPGSIIDNCVNKGKISSKFNVYTAGIAGQYKAAATKDVSVLIKKCINEGEIVADGNQGAGIVGISTNYLTIDSCSNRGTITGGFGLGGMLGNMSGNEIVISNCHNTADITSKSYRAGGLIGWGNVVGTVTNCFNSGNISTTSTTQGTAAGSGSSIGGLAGYAGATFTNCYNTGSVTGVSRVGGLLGEIFKNRTSLINCYNCGEIIAPADTCGSLIGMNPIGKDFGTDNKFLNCYKIATSEKLIDESIGNVVSERELASVEIGDGWTSCDNYTYPLLVSNSPDIAKVNAARVILKEGDTIDNVTGGFKVGCPEGVLWTSNSSNLKIDGNDVAISGIDSPLEVKLTATCGDSSKDVTLKIDNTSGLNNNIEIEPLSVRKYSLDGLEILGDAPSGIIYIEVSVSSNGETKAIRKIAK